MPISGTATIDGGPMTGTSAKRPSANRAVNSVSALEPAPACSGQARSRNRSPMLAAAITYPSGNGDGAVAVHARPDLDRASDEHGIPEDLVFEAYLASAHERVLPEPCRSGLILSTRPRREREAGDEADCGRSIAICRALNGHDVGSIELLARGARRRGSGQMIQAKAITSIQLSAGVGCTSVTI
jgi:hypothetical protein